MWPSTPVQTAKKSLKLVQSIPKVPPVKCRNKNDWAQLETASDFEWALIQEVDALGCKERFDWWY